MGYIAVLGSANMDLVVRTHRPVRVGETMAGTSFDTVPGGKGLNQSVAAARAGTHVAFIGAVGVDQFGDELLHCLEQEGISLEGTRRVPGRSGIAAISVLDSGDNSIVIVAGANNHDTALDDHSRTLITNADALITQLERPLTLVQEGLELARRAGVTTVLTPTPVQPLDSQLLELVDILVPNAGEACELTGLKDDLEAACELSQHASTVVMTRGGHGAVVAQHGQIVRSLPARPVHPVDTTGAGDTFVGVLVASMSRGQSLNDALDTATVAASLAVTRRGASTSMPTWDEILAAR